MILSVLAASGSDKWCDFADFFFFKVTDLLHLLVSSEVQTVELIKIKTSQTVFFVASVQC